MTTAVSAFPPLFNIHHNRAFRVAFQVNHLAGGLERTHHTKPSSSEEPDRHDMRLPIGERRCQPPQQWTRQKRLHFGEKG